jgi:hypothetical protein
MTDTNPPAPPRRRRIRPEALLHATALLVTTAALTTTAVKLPPYKGD